MKYLKSYSISFGGSIDGLSEEIRMPIRGGEFLVGDLDTANRKGKATVIVTVNPTTLSIREGTPPLSGGPPQRGIEVPEAHLAGRIHLSGIRLLSFLLDEPVRSASLVGTSKLLPESKTDEDRLATLEDLLPYSKLHGRLTIKSPKFSTLDEPTLQKLLDREVGLALFADAKQLTTPIGQFREFWRVLESAFGQKDLALETSLAAYQPAVELGFDAGEFRSLRVLRGRASHAESSAGLDEYERVSKDVDKQLPRLLSLVEQMLLTKASWGTKGGGFERLAPIRSYVDKEGNPVMLRPLKGD